MTMPTLIVEIGFTALSTGTALHLDDPVRGKLDTATLAAGDLFTDLTPWFVSGSTRRGATRSDGPVLRYEAGTCTFVFRNDDRRFDPTNLAGPYVAGGVTQVEPLRAVRIRASYNGHTWPLWRGFTNEWSVNYDGPHSSYATVTCFDAFGIFAAYDRIAVAAVGSGETTGARINRILDSIGWPAEDRMIATGEETVQATTLADNVLTELLLTADTELGELWIDADGRARFRARSASYTAARSTYTQALFGDLVVEGAPTTINLVPNPSLETGLTGWAAGGGAGTPTLAQSSAQAKYGTNSLLVTWASGGFLPHARYTITGLTVGRTYTASVWAYVPTGNPHVITIVGSTNQFGGETTQFDTWQRLTWTGTASSDTWSFQIWPMGAYTTGQIVYLDGLQVEEGDTATPYVDGDQDGGEWDGDAHASTSRRLPEMDYGDLTLTYDALSITNQVRAARVGGTEQTATDSGSVSAYLTRSHQRTDLLMQTDAEALVWAEQVLARRSMPELRVSALLLKPAKDPDRLWAQAFGREIGDRVRVVRRPPGEGDPIIREAWVRGIEHNLSNDLAWRTTLVLEQAPDSTRAVDTFSRSVSGGWGSAESGEPWTIDVAGTVTGSGMLIGIDAPLGAEWTAAVSDYPNIRYTRDFGKDNVWGSDADTLTEPTKYGTGKFVSLPAGAVMHLSWKDDPGLLTQWLNDLPALPTNHPGFYLSPWHEPRDEVDAGQFTTAQFRAWGQQMSDIVASHSKGYLIRGVGPILTRFDLDEQNADPALYGWADMDFFGVDCYQSNTTVPYYDTTKMFATNFTKVLTAWPGIPLMVPEYGMVKLPSDTTGSGRAAAINTHIAYLKARGDVLAVAYFQSDGSIPGVPFSKTSPEADAWRALQAAQGTGGTSGAADFSTTGTKGRLSLASVNSARAARLTSLDERFVDVLLTGVTISATPTGANCEFAIRANWDTVGDSYNEARLFWTTTNTVTANLRQRSAGVDTATSGFPAVSSATSATPLSVRFQVVGGTLRSRVWLTSGTEPSTWSVTQTTPTWLASGPVGVRAFLATGNTNTLPVRVDIDSITVTTLHAWA